MSKEGERLRWLKRILCICVWSKLFELHKHFIPFKYCHSLNAHIAALSVPELLDSASITRVHPTSIVPCERGISDVYVLMLSQPWPEPGIWDDSIHSSLCSEVWHEYCHPVIVSLRRFQSLKGIHVICQECYCTMQGLMIRSYRMSVTAV